MIKKLEVQNFQSHEHTKLDLGPCTILTGLSSSGKSSLAIRALEWLFYGEWDSTYPMYDDKPTAVAIELDDGTRILRMRKKGENLAAVIKDGKAYKYRAFGNIIPGIFDIINMRPITMGGKEVNLNISVQDQAPFLISDSRPARAQWLGRLYGAHVISAMLREMNSDKREVDRRAKTLDAESVEFMAKVKGFDSLESQKKHLRSAQKTFAEVENLMKIRELSRHVIDLDEEIEEKRWLGTFDLRALRADVRRLKVLKRLELEQLDYEKASQTLEDGLWLLRSDLKALRVLIGRLAGLRDLSSALSSNKNKAAKVADALKNSSKVLGKLQESAKENIFKGGKCPLCGSKKKISAADLAQNARQLVGGR